MNGRALVLIVVTLMLGISALTIGMTIVVVGTEGILPRLARFVFTAAICYYLYQGRNWIRWLTVVLLSLGVAIGFSNIGQALAVSPVGGAFSVLMIGAYALCVALLVFPKSVRDHFAQGEYAR